MTIGRSLKEVSPATTICFCSGDHFTDVLDDTFTFFDRDFGKQTKSIDTFFDSEFFGGGIFGDVFGGHSVEIIHATYCRYQW